MKELVRKLKNTSKFFKGMCIYLTLLMTAVIVLFALEWDKLSKYQASYDKAEAESKPEIFMDKYIKEFDENEYKEMVTGSLKPKTGYYSLEEEYLEMVKDVNFSLIKYDKNKELYKEKRPVYDIFAGENKIGMVSLKIGKTDSFGFGIWEINEMAAEEKNIFGEKLTLLIDESMKVYINGVEADLDKSAEIKEDKNIDSIIKDILGAGFREKTVLVEDYIDKADVEVKDTNGDIVSYTENEGVLNFISPAGEEEISLITNAAKDFTEAYINYTLKKGTLEKATSKTVYDRPAYHVLKNAANGLIWVKEPSTIGYQKAQISGVTKVAKNLIYCDVSYEIKSTFVTESDNVTKVENIDMKLFFVEKEGNWLVDTMKMN